MEGIYKHYIIDMSCNNNFVQVPTVQGDGNNVRGFEVELISNNVQYVVDANNTIVSIAGTKPDTKQIFNECQVTEEGYIIVDITSQMSAVPGRGDYSIVLMDKNTNSQLKSFPFYILTTASSFDVDYITSSDEFQLLTKTIVDADVVIGDAVEKITSLEELATGFTEAEKDRVEAELKRQTDTAAAIENAEQATASANTATSQLNAAITASETATNNANEATTKANTAASSANEASERAEIATTRIENLESDFSSAEAIRVTNENVRQEEEAKRKLAMTNMVNATEDAENATSRANSISDDLENKVASGYFHGKDAVITTVEMNQMAFQVVDGDLILTYEEGNTDAEKLSIDDNGDLIYTLA